MRNFWGQPVEFADLPLWRKTLIVLAMLSFFAFGGRLFNREVDIYVSAPSAANSATAEIYPVHVNHGYVRYLTRQEDADLAFWRAVTPAIVVGCIAGMALVWVMYRSH